MHVGLNLLFLCSRSLEPSSVFSFQNKGVIGHYEDNRSFLCFVLKKKKKKATDEEK